MCVCVCVCVCAESSLWLDACGWAGERGVFGAEALELSSNISALFSPCTPAAFFKPAASAILQQLKQSECVPLAPNNLDAVASDTEEVVEGLEWGRPGQAVVAPLELQQLLPQQRLMDGGWHRVSVDCRLWWHMWMCSVCVCTCMCVCVCACVRARACVCIRAYVLRCTP